jgi:medium-chain acyl-[acyl-carrier-protein] hydrolase
MNTFPNGNPWFAHVALNPRAMLRLFCFPHAGGGASTFRNWSSGLPLSVEVWPIQPPGRETRMLEAPFTRLMQLAQAIEQAIRPYLDRPFAFFGHSMGARVCFEVARLLRQCSGPQPVSLFISADRAPQLSNPNAPIHALPKDEFIAELRRLNGTPESVLQCAELMELLLPLLRADLTLIETYAYQPQAPLDCSISAMGGLQDPEANRQELDAWREQTRGSFTLRIFPGDHFFLASSKAAVLAALSQDLKQLVSQTQGPYANVP